MHTVLTFLMHCYFVSFVTPLRLKKDRLLAFTYLPTYPHKLTNLNYQSKAIAIAIATQYRSRTIPQAYKQTNTASKHSKQAIQRSTVPSLQYSFYSQAKPKLNKKSTVLLLLLLLVLRKTR